MKLKALVGGEERSLDLKRDGGELKASVDGREYDLEISEPEPGVFLLKHEGKIYEAYVGEKSSDGIQTVQVKGNSIGVILIDPKKLGGGSGAGAAADGTAEIKSAMPGKVVRVLVEAGSEVKQGDGIVVVEAMKMQNELKAPKDGVVATIAATEGATVAAGEVLAIVE